MKRAFKVKQITFFLISKVLFCTHIEQASKNVVGTTFKYHSESYSDLLL